MSRPLAHHSGERWPQSPQPLPPSPRSWFPPTSKPDRGELEALASPQGGGGGRRLPGRGRPEGWRTCLPMNNRRYSGRPGHWRSSPLVESLPSISVTAVGWRPLPRFSRPPSCRGQRRLSPLPAPLFPPPARGYRWGGGAQARRCAFMPLLSPHNWCAPPVVLSNTSGK